MDQASEILREEHELILIALDILETVSEKAMEGQPVNWEDMSELAEFLKLFADKWHHGKEEGVYFPAIEAAGIPRDGGPLGVMYFEHTLGRALMAKLSATSAAHQAQEFAAAAMEYVELMAPHIEKENLMLYMMGDSRLSDKETARVIASYADYEKGAEEGARIPRLIERLGEFKKAYLG